MVFFSPLVLLALSSAAIALPAPEEHTLQSRALPTPLSLADAKTAAAALVVAVESNSPVYDRDLFPTWITISGTCNTRETVLVRDGSGVTVDSACVATAGSWYSVYDGETWPLASDVDIDHVVPLKEAWVSGASSWTTAARQAFANDVVRPQLIAVTDNVNQSKGDKDPAEWMPPLASYYCTYIRAWVTVKSYYELTVDSAEKAAITSYLDAC